MRQIMMIISVIIMVSVRWQSGDSDDENAIILIKVSSSCRVKQVVVAEIISEVISIESAMVGLSGDSRYLHLIFVIVQETIIRETFLQGRY